ncbi:hypothetical protein BC829DRAFT_165859 [Chytridium lagenaria]|nr:hypothetical protein BC829DRAFT_165859 [Chytridium lagenaria]
MTVSKDPSSECRDILKRASEAASAHRKCAVALRNLHSRLEKAFFYDVMWTSMLPLFASKRGTPECDRALKFVDFYMEFLENEWRKLCLHLLSFF